MFPKSAEEWKKYESTQDAYRLYCECEKRMKPFNDKLRELAEKKLKFLKELEQEEREVLEMRAPLERELSLARANYHNARALDTDWKEVSDTYAR